MPTLTLSGSVPPDTLYIYLMFTVTILSFTGHTVAADWNMYEFIRQESLFGQDQKAIRSDIPNWMFTVVGRFLHPVLPRRQNKVMTQCFWQVKQETSFFFRDRRRCTRRPRPSLLAVTVVQVTFRWLGSGKVHTITDHKDPEGWGGVEV